MLIVGRNLRGGADSATTIGATKTTAAADLTTIATITTASVSLLPLPPLLPLPLLALLAVVVVVVVVVAVVVRNPPWTATRATRGCLFAVFHWPFRLLW